MRFLAAFFVVLAAGLGGTAGVCLIVDPYDVWRTVDVLRDKPEQIFHDRMHKAHELRHLRPDVVFLGTSRTQVGLDPKSPALRGATAVNAALSDGTPYEALRYLQHARALGDVKIAVMGLDLLSFDVGTPPNVEYDDRRLATTIDGRPQPLYALQDAIPTLLTVDALRSSARTIKKQGQPSYFHRGGQRDTRFMEERVVEQGGQRKNFLHSERSYLDSYACFDLLLEGPDARTIADLRALVAYARDAGISLRLFFSPSHARSQLVVLQAGHWLLQQAWREQVVRVVEEEGGDVQVWDFVGAGRFTGEAVPALDDATSRTAHYWESSHYKSALGELVLARVLRGEGADGFGVRLTPGNVRAENDRVENELLRWAAAHPDDAREIAKLAAEVLPPRRARCAAEEAP